MCLEFRAAAASILNRLSVTQFVDLSIDDRHLILLDPCFNFRVIRLRVAHGVQFTQTIQHASAEGTRQTVRIVQVQDRFFGAAQFDALPDN